MDSRELRGQISWDNISLVTVNTNGIKKNGHLLIENILMKHSLSCVQETKLRDSQHLATLAFHHDARFRHKLFVGDHNASTLVAPPRRTGGVLTVLRSDFPGYETAKELHELSVLGRYLVIEVVVNHASLFIHNVYAPVDNEEKAAFFEHLPTDIFGDNSTHLVLGDLNTALDPAVDASGTRSSSSTGRSACLGWLGQLGVVDAWRIHHPEDRVFSGPHPRKNRLDYILLSNDFCGAVYGDSKYFEPKGAGDHLAHQVTLRSMAQLHGRGFWRFPARLLDYPDVVQAIEMEAQNARRQLRQSCNPGKTWHQWKYVTRKLLQALDRKLRGQQERAVRVAHRTLMTTEEQYRSTKDKASHIAFQTALQSYKDCVSTSRAYSQDSAFDFQASVSEKSSKFFFRPIDSSLRRVSIENVLLADGELSNNLADISNTFRDHWGSILGDPKSTGGQLPDPSEHMIHHLLHTIHKTLSDEEASVLNAPVTASDLAASIRKMRAHSAPGLDGFTAAFYQVAPDVFGECLEIVFNYQLTRGELLPCQRQSAISLLHKKGERANPGNYRPIALMGVDVKALSKVLAFRLQLYLPKLVHPDQKAFVKGRSMHQHVRFLSDLQNLITKWDTDGYAVFLDFEKAYDRVNWHFMFKILDRMGCGGQFLRWVKLLYTRPVARLLINGHVQEAIHPTRGVKQGDPLSALLFLLVIEPLGNLLRQHDEHGICLTDDFTVTSVFFADDSTLLSNSSAGVQAQLRLVDEFCQGSGAKLNRTKCVLMSLNRSRVAPSMDDLQSLGFDDTVKYLGILFGQRNTSDDIISFLDQRFYDGFKMWHRRARTIDGRLLLAQTMVLSRLWHYTMHVVVPDRLLKQWQAALHRFVLGRKYERGERYFQLVPNEILHKRRDKGGLQLPNISDLVQRQRIQTLLRFVNDANPINCNWTTPGLRLIAGFFPDWGPQSPLDFLTVNPRRHGFDLNWTSLPTWWRITWRNWFELRWPVTWHDIAHATRLEYAMQEPIWFHGDPIFQYEQQSRVPGQLTSRRSLCMVAEPQRSFRRHMARAFRIRALADVLDGDGHWPSEANFAETHIDYSYAAVHPYKQFRWLKTLYRELLQVFLRIATLCGTPVNSAISRTSRISAPYVGVLVNGRVHVAPDVSRLALLHLIQKPSTHIRPHPITLHDNRTSDGEVTRFIQLRKRLRQLLLPIFDDLQFRVAFRLLPVRSRFSFLSVTDPDIIYCPKDGCALVETERHLFFECTLAAALWTCISHDWKVFFRKKPSWYAIALGRPPCLFDKWATDRSGIEDMWHILRSVTLHLLWTERNSRIFNKSRPMPPIPALRVIYTTFSAHIRACFRRNYDDLQQTSLRRLLHELKRTPSLGGFMQQNATLFQVRFLD